MKKKSVYTWYVEALGAHTNEAIALQPGGTDQAECGVLCQDGVKRDLWRCDYSFIRRLQQSKQNAQINFLVFNRRGEHGAVRPWRFTKSRKAAAVARRRLAAMRGEAKAS